MQYLLQGRQAAGSQVPIIGAIGDGVAAAIAGNARPSRQWPFAIPLQGTESEASTSKE